MNIRNKFRYKFTSLFISLCILIGSFCSFSVSSYAAYLPGTTAPGFLPGNGSTGSNGTLFSLLNNLDMSTTFEFNNSGSLLTSNLEFAKNYSYNPLNISYTVGDNYYNYNDISNTYSYTPVSYNTTNNNYMFYNPITNTYNYSNDVYYNQTYNTYRYDVNNYSNYYIEGDTYYSYYVVNNDDPSDYQYYEVYFKLPDGRNSYNLTRDDLKGIVDIYNFDLYDYADLDTSLGLWHLNGSTFDSSSNGGSGTFSGTNFVDGYFDAGINLNSSGNLTLNVGTSIPSSYTLEWIQYDGNSSTGSVVPSSPSYKDVNLYSYGLSGYYYNPILYQYIYYYTGTDTRTDYKYIATSGYHHYAYVSSTNSYYRDGVKFNPIYSQALPVVNSNTIVFRSYTDSQYSSTDMFSYTGKAPYNGVGLASYESTRNSSYLYRGSSRADITYRTEYTTPYYNNRPMETTSATLADVKIYNYDQYLYTVYNRNSIIDEVRLSEGALYDSNYEVRQEPFDSSFAFVVPSDPVEKTVYLQSLNKPSNFQIGGVRQTNPRAYDVFISLDNGIGTGCSQFYGGQWHSIGASIYYNGSFVDIVGFDFLNLRIVGSDSTSINSGNIFEVDLSDTNSYLSSITNTLNAWFVAWSIGGTKIDIGSEPEGELHWYDVLLPLAYVLYLFLILIAVLGLVISFMDYVLHFYSIPAYSGNLDQDFVKAFDFLRANVPDEQKFYIFNYAGITVTIFDFMVILFEIAFIGTVVVIIRKYIDKIHVPTFKE